MRTILLTCITMVAFASNSVLNRLAVDSGEIDPSSFALIRVISGVIMLGMLLTARGGQLRLFAPGRLVGSLSLAVYMIGFSLAYMVLDAGIGALILFGTVQITMFTWAFLSAEQPSKQVLLGAAVAFLGLLIALWPEPGATFGFTGALFMVCAGLGWAAYTMRGRGAKDPLAETTANFAMSLPFLSVLLLGPDMWARPFGIGLAVVSGAVTSGMGYALWYYLLPKWRSDQAAVIQLSVPLIAIAAGVLLLGEALTVQLIVSAVLVVGGIGMALIGQSSRDDHKAS